MSEAKQAATRTRRVEQTAERLFETMEAEWELPPIIQAAFARSPRARQGWERMAPSQRRMQLLGIFYYRNPESRARRVTKAVQAAAEVAERLGGSGGPQNCDICCENCAAS